VGAGSFTPNQYAIVTIGPSVAVFAAAYLGCVLNDDGPNFYSIIVNSAGDYFIIKNGSNLAFAAAPILAVGDTLELDNVGGVITAYHNGTQFATVTDASPLTGGAP
jgi:hypothetical protein